MKETYFNEKLEKVSFKRRKDSLLYSRLYSFNVYFIYHTHMFWGPGWLNELGRWI
jgi:ammonia channel protein AmtB